MASLSQSASAVSDFIFQIAYINFLMSHIIRHMSDVYKSFQLLNNLTKVSDICKFVYLVFLVTNHGLPRGLENMKLSESMTLSAKNCPTKGGYFATGKVCIILQYFTIVVLFFILNNVKFSTVGKIGHITTQQ